jgi:putative transposase
MARIHRYYIPNAWIFITCVTHNRIPYLESGTQIKSFWQVLTNVQKIHPFHLFAYALLPDHFHWIMRVSEATSNFSTVLQSVKRNYTLELKRVEEISTPLVVWQPRFWDHVIRDEEDFSRHFDYIHYNPVKHGYINQPGLWEHSSFSYWYKRGEIPEDWGNNTSPESINGMDFE